jgi:endonuclease YncB( thermonuclease family)
MLSALRIASLVNCDKNTPLFSLNGVSTFGIIVGNYDGDTCDIVIAAPILNENVRFKCRLMGIDCAEIRTKCKDEKCHAKRARQFVADWHKNDVIYLKCHKFDSFGRLLVDVYRNMQSPKSLSDILLENGYAYKYCGKNKRKFYDWADRRYWQSNTIISPKPIISNSYEDTLADKLNNICLEQVQQ